MSAFVKVLQKIHDLIMHEVCEIRILKRDAESSWELENILSADERILNVMKMIDIFHDTATLLPLEVLSLDDLEEVIKFSSDVNRCLREASEIRHTILKDKTNSA